MYIYDRQLKVPEPKPITSVPEFQAEMEEYKKLQERRESLRKEHEKRLAPPLDLFPMYQDVPDGDFIGQPRAKAAPTISKAGADRINRVSKTMTQALRLAEEALPFLKTSAQKELLKQMVGGLGTFFPAGFGIFNEKGEAVKASARMRFETNIRQPGGAISRVYIYDTRLFMSDQHSPSAAGDHRAIGDRASHIRLYARQLASTRPQELVGVAIHEMTHMLRAIVRSFVGRFGSAAASEFPWRETAPLLDFSRLDSHRIKMEAHFARLIAVLEKQANVRFDANFAAFRAGQLLEEVLAHVFTERVSDAMAKADAVKKAKKGPGEGIGLGVGFEPMKFLNEYISSHWFSETALISALKSPQAQSVIRGMSDDLRAIVGAMETQVGP